MSTGQLTREPRSTLDGDAAAARPLRGGDRPMPSLRLRRLRALGLLLALLLLVWGCVRLISWASDGPTAVRIAGDTAVGVLDLTTGVTTSYQPDVALPTASIVKVDILAALLLRTHGDPT